MKIPPCILIDMIWSRLKFFKRNENWGDPDKMAESILLEIDAFREHMATPMIITSGNNGSHSKKSYHYVENGSCAVDMVLPDFQGHPADLLFQAMKFKFKGIGYYSHWKYQGKPVVGLHLDTRPTQIAVHWIGRPDGTYLPLSLHYLDKPK